MRKPFDGILSLSLAFYRPTGVRFLSISFSYSSFFKLFHRISILIIYSQCSFSNVQNLVCRSYQSLEGVDASQVDLEPLGYRIRNNLFKILFPQMDCDYYSYFNIWVPIESNLICISISCSCIKC